jgi:hypothetical protein
MATCPKCSSKISVIRLLGMGKLNRYGECINCRAILEVDSKFLAALPSGLSGLSAVLFYRGSLYLKEGSKQTGLTLLTIALVLLIYTSYYHIKHISLIEVVGDEWKKHYKPIRIPEKPFSKPQNRIERLKNIHFRRSDSELFRIIESPEYTPEAKQAVQELINERQIVNDA